MNIHLGSKNCLYNLIPILVNNIQRKYHEETITSHKYILISLSFRVYTILVWEVWVEKEVPHRPQAEEKSENWAKWGDSSNTREGAGEDDQDCVMIIAMLK